MEVESPMLQLWFWHTHYLREIQECYSFTRMLFFSFTKKNNISMLFLYEKEREETDGEQRSENGEKD